MNKPITNVGIPNLYKNRKTKLSANTNNYNTNNNTNNNTVNNNNINNNNNEIDIPIDGTNK